MSDCKALVCPRRPKTRRQTFHYDDDRDYAEISAQTFYCSPIQFLPAPGSYFKKLRRCISPRDPEGIFTAKAPESHSLRFKEGEESAKFLDSSDKDSAQKPDSDPEQ